MMGTCFSGFESIPADVPLYRGKVRDVIDLGDRLIITATDRISAFDKVLSTIPRKGEILNRTTCRWFDLVADLIPNHLLDVLSARTVVARKARVLPVEVVVRGYLTGSAWRDYEAERPVSGIYLPRGMKKNQAFDTPLLTPSTKEEKGKHDEPVSEEEIIRRGIVDADLWNIVRQAALALFQRGTEVVRDRGLILVDTKYEFGVTPEGDFFLIDEVHTPDSSRYWYADGYEKNFARGAEQRQLDKEFFRKWLLDRGYKGDGTPPEIPDEVRLDVSKRYIEAFEAVTGEKFIPESLDAKAEEEIVLSYIAEHR